jgi:hypothetical protein
VFSESSLKAQLNCDFPCDNSSWEEHIGYPVLGVSQNAVGTGVQGTGLNGVVKYYVRECNGVIEFRIDSLVLLDNSHFLDSLMMNEHNYTVFRDLIDMHIMEQYIGITTMPDCPESNLITKIYSASCGVLLKCRYEVAPGSRMCDIGFATPYPDFMIDTTQYVDIWKWESCGEVCCEKIYSVCRKRNLANVNNITSITQLSKQRYSHTPTCTLEGQFRDGKDTTIIIPCKDGC